MKVLLAEDEIITRTLVSTALQNWGFDVIACGDGAEAWKAINAEDAPKLLVLDWMMPEIDGVEICRKVRAQNLKIPPYIIIITARNSARDIVTGLEAGADDYLAKPVEYEELNARVRIGKRTLQLYAQLEEKIAELQDSLSQIKQLQGLLPICGYCKKIRDDKDYWQQIDAYVSNHSEIRFNHSICPECYEKSVKPRLEKYGQNKEASVWPAKPIPPS